MQSTLGQSQPSVKSMALVIASYLPFSKSLSIFSLSFEEPFTSIVSIPLFFNSPFRRWLMRTRGVKITVFRPLHSLTIESAIASKYKSKAWPNSFGLKSPASVWTLLISTFKGIVLVRILHRYPSFMASGSLYSNAKLSKTSDRDFISALSGVAVTPNTFAWLKYSRMFL